MAAHEFDSDKLYRDWLKRHPLGFVLNVRANHKGDYAVLHSARCKAISTDREQGAYTERDYRKVCDTSREELEDWLRNLGHESFSAECRCTR